jgi:acyl carrier protein
VRSAERRLGPQPHLSYRLLDIERDPADQGYAAGSFDVVIASNVLHATKRLDETVSHARTLVAPGGLLVLYEVTDPPTWLEITFGLFEGWNRFDDALRTADEPTLTREAWVNLLSATGFERVAAWPETGSPAEALRAHVFVAQAPGALADRGRAARPLRRDEADYVSDIASGAAGGSTISPNGRNTGALLEALGEAAPTVRRDLLVDFVRAHTTAVLRRDPREVIDRRERLMDLGVDSLMAVELRDRLTQALPLTRKLPTTLIFDYPTIEAMAALLEACLPGTPKPEVNEAANGPSEDEARIRDLSDDEIESLLLKKLDTLG